MLHMVGCFHLDSTSVIELIREDYQRYVSHLKSIDLIVKSGPIGRRHANTPMDTDKERDYEYFILMTFRNRAQMDAAYTHIQNKAEPAVDLHLQFMKNVKDPVFFCWEDI